MPEFHLNNQGEWDGQKLYHGVQKWEMRMLFHKENFRAIAGSTETEGSGSLRGRHVSGNWE